MKTGSGIIRMIDAMAPYTHWNLALFAIWASMKRILPHSQRFTNELGAVLWCNSIAVAASYESVRILNADAYASFVRTISPWREDILAHWIPIFVLWWERRDGPLARKRHVVASAVLELLWATTIQFDLSVPYPAITPPLTARESAMIWLFGFLGHIAPLKPRLAWWVPYGAWVAMILREAVAQGY